MIQVAILNMIMMLMITIIMMITMNDDGKKYK